MSRLLAIAGDELDYDVGPGARVTKVTAEGVTLSDGSFIASELVVWAAGVKAPAVLGATRRAGGQSHQSVRRRANLADDARPRHLRHRRLRRLSAPRLTRAGAAAGAGGASGGIAHGCARSSAGCAARHCCPTNIATSDHWSRSAAGAPSAT